MSTKPVEFWIHTKPNDDTTIDLGISRERLASALIGHASETAPIIIHNAWANGDEARVIVRRIPWRETAWREVWDGWRKGPYRVWCDGADPKDCYRVACLERLIYAHPFVSLEAAQAAAMKHADEQAAQGAT